MRKQIHDNPLDHGRACALSHGTWRRVGAKLACAGACALMVGQLLLPSVALAAKWVNVGGTQYNKGAGDEAGTWSWDGADDMKLNGYNGAGISAQGNLNIGVTGTNTVTADSLQSAIEVKDGNLAITGEGTLNATAEPQKSRSAVKVECGSLAISGDVTLNATAGTDTIAVSGDGKAGGDVDIRGANVNVTATNKVPHTIGIHTRAGNITINEGADVHVEAEANGGLNAVAVYAENISSEHGGCIAVDNAKLDAAARNANMLSVALYSSGGKDTYLSITTGRMLRSWRVIVSKFWMVFGCARRTACRGCSSRIRALQFDAVTELATVVNMATEYIPSPAPSPPSLELTSLIQMLRCRVMQRQSTLSIKVMQPLVSQLMADR